MKITIGVTFAILVASALAAEPSTYLRTGFKNDDIKLDRHRTNDGGDDGDEGKGKDEDDNNNTKVKYGQGMVSIHGMTRHPTAADVKIIEEVVAAAFNNVHPDSKWKMTEFHDTWVQVFEEENDPEVLAASGVVKVGRGWNVPDWNWNLKDIWGSLGGFGSFACELCREGAVLSAQSMDEMLGSSAVGDEVCKLLVKSGAEIFEQVYDCAMSTKPTALAVENIHKPTTEHIE